MGAAAERAADPALADLLGRIRTLAALWHTENDLGWFLEHGILTPAGVTGDTFAGVYAAGFAQAAAAPPFAESEAGAVYFDAIAEYVTGHEQDGKAFPHCVWSWMAGEILEEAFTKMTEPTRESFYEALTSISNLETDFSFGPIDTTVDGAPAVQTVILQKFNGAGYSNVEVVG